MFERFTEEARQVVIRARQDAIDLRHPLIGTEHLLLALVEGSGPAAEVLSEAGVDPATVRTDLQRLVGTAPPLIEAEDAEALRSVGIDVDAVLARIQESFGPEALLPPKPVRRGWFGRGAVRGRFAPRSKKVLELALREALRANSSGINSGHLLLGLLREGEGLACQILADSGVDLAQLRARTESKLRRAA